MRVLYLHGWHSAPGGVKPTLLRARGHEVMEPALDDHDFTAAVAAAQAAVDRQRPQVMVGSSRGGAVAMNVRAEGVPLVLLCPAWRRWGTADRVPPGTMVLHSEQDEVIPIEDSRELVRRSGLPASALVVVGEDHRLADPEPLEALARAVAAAGRRE